MRGVGAVTLVENNVVFVQVVPEIFDVDKDVVRVTIVQVTIVDVVVGFVRSGIAVENVVEICCFHDIV